MLLLVGLGNPGDNYQHTRHNIGFDFLDMLAERHKLTFSASSRLRATSCVWHVGRSDQQVILLKPMTYMNNSGESVVAAAHYYKIKPEQVFVAYDDLDLAVGKMRLRQGGGHGGHNGLRSIHQHLGAEHVRIRIGIGRSPHKKASVSDWVLSRPPADDAVNMQIICNHLIDEIDNILTGDLAKAATRIHLALQS
ncbi:MAG: aminoacyl-tRNA hydrolase [Mariprofundales bacterium]